MIEVAVRSAVPVTLLGAGACRAEDLEAALAIAPVLVAADGGATTALAHGLSPVAVVGDLDSVGPETLAALPDARVLRIAEQETTDFDKGLCSIEAPLVLGVGFLGDRLDHELAAMSVLVRRGRPCLLIGPWDVVFAAPPRLRIALAAGTRVSLFPLAEVSGRSHGLLWPIDGIEFGATRRAGTSNQALGEVRLEMDAPGMLVLLPREALAVAVEALLAPD
ncbi:thiamine diphosphokinase [Roseitranquillus sediminis]|uniref:thiamine diphosphokinase n=1 Tax=Roseitranquillus sediminis TaxID=2809051 RepID=UPI001D0C49E7|nr:thiamine diphosphokinase [Roseitranquillus sediminis]MBM9596458.1 thiamine diphosphokinase [Roseitranquillus sediminis]